MKSLEYYTKGFTRGKFEGKPHEDMMVVLSKLFNDKNPNNGFLWEQKYPNTFDLRPNVHGYHPSFLDVLFSSNVPKLLNDAVGSDLVLFHVQVRKSMPGPSYMDWHRDSYNYGKPVGNIPPVHKVIFYPSLPLVANTEKLKLCVGSHHRQFPTQKQDMQCLESGIDQLPVEVYLPSKDEFMLFDTSILHAAAADVSSSIRVIYSFIRSPQFEEHYANVPIHAEQCKLYREKLNP